MVDMLITNVDDAVRSLYESIAIEASSEGLFIGLSSITLDEFPNDKIGIDMAGDGEVIYTINDEPQKYDSFEEVIKTLKNS